MYNYYLDSYTINIIDSVQVISLAYFVRRVGYARLIRYTLFGDSVKIELPCNSLRPSLHVVNVTSINCFVSVLTSPFIVVQSEDRTYHKHTLFHAACFSVIGSSCTRTIPSGRRRR